VVNEVPSALLARSGRFVPLNHQHGTVAGRSSALPDRLPDALAEIAPWRFDPGTPPHAGPDWTTVFLTIDTEDAYFTRPHLMTGEGIGRDFGVFGILDELDARGMRATFFVNLYESGRQPTGVVEGVVREIAERGHEVGLHTHPSPTLEFYRRPLFRLPRSAQADVLRWGADRIERWTGERVTSFRAGGYALNDETFAALSEVGIEIDSSCFFPSPNNHLAPFTINAVAARGGTIEVPVTVVLRAEMDGRLEHRKLDLDWLSVDQLISALKATVAHGADFAMFMMHSFSFIEKETRPSDQPPSQRALFTSEKLFNRYVEIYGPKPHMRQGFASFLDRVAGDPSMRVRTLRDSLPYLRAATARALPDIVPVVSRSGTEGRP
jgi:peptidoglycan/xylan/chitin deacetylase (PgdA/CDA1 family)